MWEGASEGVSHNSIRHFSPTQRGHVSKIKNEEHDSPDPNSKRSSGLDRDHGNDAEAQGHRDMPGSVGRWGHVHAIGLFEFLV